MHACMYAFFYHCVPLTISHDAETPRQPLTDAEPWPSKPRLVLTITRSRHQDCTRREVRLGDGPSIKEGMIVQAITIIDAGVHAHNAPNASAARPAGISPAPPSARNPSRISRVTMRSWAVGHDIAFKADILRTLLVTYRSRERRP
jgi:hypothetical protein